MNETKYLPAIQGRKYRLPAASERMENEEWRMKTLNTGEKTGKAKVEKRRVDEERSNKGVRGGGS